MHPLLQLLSLRPSWLAEHADAYGELLAAETAGLLQVWQRRVLWLLAALAAGTVALALAGVACLLWAVLPPEQLRLPWVLVLVPLAAAVVAVLCALAARPRGEGPAYAGFRQQARADIDMLREATTP
jgi:hypothetical protein